MEEQNYEQDLAINPDELAADLMDQPLLYFRYSEKYAQSILERDRAKDNFAQVQAQLDSDIRNFPEKYGIPKVTEAAIKSAILLDKKYAKANEDVLNTNLVCMTIQGAVNAFEHRKRMLEKITELKISGLYADPSIRKEVRNLTSEALSDLQQEKLNQSMTKREEASNPKKVRRILGE